MIPLFVCLVRMVDINMQGNFAYEIVECVRATADDYQKVYNQFAQNMYSMPRHTIMLFVRPPDESPMVAYEDAQTFQPWRDR